MTFNTKDLRDGHLPLVERIDIALRRVTNGEGQMRVPVEATDPDIVLHNCRDRIVELEGLLREHEGVTRDAVAVTLAGNALAGELAKALADIDRLQRELAEARAQIAAITPTADSETWRRACNDARDELAEARAQIAAKDKRIAELGSALDAPGLSGLVSWRRHDLTVKELAKAEAQIAALRPKAEAWDAYEDYWQTCVASDKIQSIGVRWPSFAEVSEKRSKAEAAADRAREATK